jgi:pyruvate dehydrogenase E2 component (dihydrolipoamide acetyltransferase)
MPEIQMPKLSDTMTEGTLVAWKKKKGDKVSTGDVIAEIETDKATMEWESPEDGVLTEIYVEEGGKVEIGERIAFIGAEGEEAPAAAEKKPKAEEKTEPEEPAEAKATEPAPPNKEEKEKAEPKPKEKKSRSQTRTRAIRRWRRGASESVAARAASRGGRRARYF